MSTDVSKFIDRKTAAAFLTERGFRTAPATLAKLACLAGDPSSDASAANLCTRRRHCLNGRLAVWGRRFEALPEPTNRRTLRPDAMSSKTRRPAGQSRNGGSALDLKDNPNPAANLTGKQARLTKRLRHRGAQTRLRGASQAKLRAARALFDPRGGRRP